MTQRIFYKCDAPDCDREVDEEGELRVLERTAFERGAVNVERRHACSAACEAVVLRESAWRLLAAPSETGSYRDAAKADGARERYVTPEGFTLLPSTMLRDLGVEEGGVVWFKKIAGRWTAFKDGETVREVPVHAEACGTEYRGCAPDCPKDRAEQAACQAEKDAEDAQKWTKGARWRNPRGRIYTATGRISDDGCHYLSREDGPDPTPWSPLVVNEENGWTYLGHEADKAERGWYVLPGKRGFDGTGWFETREAAVEGLERDVLGPFPTMHKARQAREMVYPVLAPSALSDLLRLAGRHVPAAVVKTWSVADQHEAEAWAAFTLSDAQCGVRRAPPEPAHVREGAIIKLQKNSMYGKVSGPISPWRSTSGLYTKIGEKTDVRSIDARSRFPVEYFSQKGMEELRSKAMHFCPNLQCAGSQKIGPGACEKCGAGLVTSVVRMSIDPDQNNAPEPSQVPTASEPLAPQSCSGNAEACPAAPQKATTIPSVVRVSWKTEDGTYSCDVDVAKGATFYMADRMITVDPLPVRPAAEFHQIAPTDPDRETAPTGERPPPSAVERTAGIRYSETTPKERAAVDRIKSAYHDLTLREKNGSHTDVITDLTVAIVAEMRRAAHDGFAEARRHLHEVLDEAGADKNEILSERIWSLAEMKTSLSIKVGAADKALDDAGSPADPSLFERIQWLTRRAAQADRVHALLDEAGFAPDTSLPGRVHDALTDLLDSAGVAGQRPLKQRVADLRDRVTAQQGANERVRAAEKDVEEAMGEGWYTLTVQQKIARYAKFSAEMKVERDTLRDQKRENDATIERLQTELRRQRNELLAELNEVRDERNRWITAAQFADHAAKTSTSERDTLRTENMRLAKELAKLREEYERERNVFHEENSRLRSEKDDEVRAREQWRTAAVKTKNRLAEIDSTLLDVVLHCPACGTQHVDAPDPEKGWTDPAHRSHLCASCGCVWRAADVPTRGVAAPTTRGGEDTWPDPRGDGPGWYVSGSSIGWFTSRTRAVPRLYAGEVRGPFPNAVEARSMTSETNEDRDRIALDIEAAEDLIARSTYREVPSRVIRSWSRDDLVEAVTWAAYDSGEDYHCKIRLVRDIAPCPPAPKHVEQAHRAQLAEYAAQAAKRGSQPC